MTQARSALVRDTSPGVSAADQATLAAGNASFAFDMYGALRAAGSPSDNLFFSPYSMSSALAMAYAGAGGQTATEIATAMGFTLPPARLHPAFDWLDLQLASRADVPQGPNAPTPFQLSVTNSLWGDQHLTFQAPFLDTLAVDYGAGVQLVDFSGQPDAARLAINLWVADQTNDRVSDLLPPQSIDSSTLFVIVDAIYFKAGWASPFRSISTTPQAFTRLDGTSEQTPTMQQTSTWQYAEGSGWQILEVPYMGGQVAMDIVLPAQGTDAAFDAGLTSAEFASMTGAMAPQLVSLSLPKFKVAGPTFSIKNELQALGVNLAWTGAADFTPMTPGGASLGDAFQQSFVSVDENGTEAAAATAVIGVDGGISNGPPPQVVSVTVDHPFFFAIRDVPTGTALFAGKIEDPAK